MTCGTRFPMTLTQPAVLLISVVLLVGCASTPTTPETSGDYSHLMGEPSGGAADPRKFSLESTKDPVEARAKAKEAIGKGDTDRALFFYVKAVEVDDKDVESLLAIGDIHATRGNTELAVAAFRMALAADENNVHANEQVGLLALKSSRYADAKIFLNRALAQDANRVRCANGLGVIADIEGDPATAQDYYERALKQAPNSPPILNNYAYSLYLSGNWERAEQMYRKLLNLVPNHAQGSLNYGLLLARQGQAKPAFDVFKRVVSDAQAYNEIGYIYMMERRYEEARQLFQMAISTSPSYFAKAYENLEQVRALQPEQTPMPDSLRQSVLKADDLPATQPVARTQAADPLADLPAAPAAETAATVSSEIGKRFALDTAPAP